MTALHFTHTHTHKIVKCRLSLTDQQPLPLTICLMSQTLSSLVLYLLKARENLKKKFLILSCLS